MKNIVKIWFLIIIVFSLVSCSNIEKNKKDKIDNTIIIGGEETEDDVVDDVGDYDLIEKYDEELDNAHDNEYDDYFDDEIAVSVEENEDIEWADTFDSDLFIKIGYDSFENQLYLLFRSNNCLYRYDGFYSSDWFDFRFSSIKESFYLEKIKGKYRCEKQGSDGEFYYTLLEEDYDNVIGYTSRGTPIIDKPEADIDWRYTFDSDCFSKIGYDDENERLYVVFYETNEQYRYSKVPSYVWYGLLLADSKGGYYNENIKGEYYCEKIDEFAQYSPDRWRERYITNGYYDEESKKIIDEYEERYNEITAEYERKIQEINNNY